MFGKRPLSSKAVILAQLLLIVSASQAFATADTEWLHIARVANDFRRSGDFQRAREYWVKALKQNDLEKVVTPWTGIALRNLAELSLQIKDIDAAEKYSVRYVAELEKLDSEYPDLARALIIRGKVYAIRKQFDRSTECLKKARKIAHDAPVNVLDRSEALTFLSANYDVLNDRKNAKLCEKELIDILVERRPSEPYLLVHNVLEQLLEFAKQLPEKERKSYLRVARDYSDYLINDPKRFCNSDRIPMLLIATSDISNTIGDKKRVYSDLVRAKEFCQREPHLTTDFRALMFAHVSNAFAKLQHYVDAAQCLNVAKKLSGGKKYDYGWHLNRAAGESFARTSNFKQAREYYQEALETADGLGQRAVTLLDLATCDLELGDATECYRHFDEAWKLALQLKKNPSAKTTDLDMIKTGLNNLTKSATNNRYPQLASKAHADVLILQQGHPSTNALGDYAYQAALEIDANQLSAAEKNLKAGLALNKYSMDEPEIVPKNPNTDSGPTDHRRWLYMDTFRLRGLLALYMHDMKTADNIFQQYLTISDKTKWIVGSNYCKFNCAMYYLQSKKLKESRRLFEGIIKFTEEKPTLEEFRTTSMFWYAVALCEDYDFAESEKYIQKVTDRAPKSNNHKTWLSLCDAVRGRIQSLKGHHEEAQALFEKAVIALEKSGRKSAQDIANILYWQIEDYLAQNQPSKARELARKAVPLFEIMHLHMFSYETECRKILGSK